MRRLLFVIAGALATAMFAAGPALADSPHFISEGTASINSAGTYVVTHFKEAGLGTTVSTETITLHIDTASAVYACINGGGNHPSATNKETVSTSLTTTGSFPVRNGQTTGDISAGPPGPGTFKCPSGQTRVLADVSYSGVELIGLAGDTSTEPNLSRCFESGDLATQLCTL